MDNYTFDWIPCSERLPDKNGEQYLVLHGCEYGYWCQVVVYYNGWNCTKYDSGSELFDIVAWMELPYHPKFLKENTQFDEEFKMAFEVTE